MKKTIPLIGAGLILAVALPSCKKPAEGTAIEKADGTSEIADVTLDKAGVAPAGRSIADAIIGYWVPDKEEILVHMKKQAEDAGVPMNPRMMEAMERSASSTILEITPTGYILYSQGPTMEMSYTLNVLDEKAGTFEVNVTHSDGKVTTDHVTIDGDTMRMEQGTMLRITDAEFLARKGEIIKLQRPPLPGASDPGPQ